MFRAITLAAAALTAFTLLTSLVVPAAEPDARQAALRTPIALPAGQLPAPHVQRSRIPS